MFTMIKELDVMQAILEWVKTNMFTVRWTFGYSFLDMLS